MSNPMQGWRSVTLEDICTDIFAGGDVPKDGYSKEKTAEFNIPIYSNGVQEDGLYGYTDRARVDEPAITISARGTIGYAIKRETAFFPIIRLVVLLPKTDLIDISFLYYAVSSIAFSNSGVSIPQLTVPMVKAHEIPLPPLDEQKRIVAILDEAFAGIDKAIANTERNLANAKELFESYLNSVFANPGEDWEEKTLGEVLILEYGKPLPENKRSPNGKYPVYGANGARTRTNEFLHDRRSIIVGRKGSAGEVNLTSGKFWPLDVTYYVKTDEQKYDIKFLFNALRNLNLPKLAKGVKPGINRNEVYEISMQLPPVDEQKRIVAELDALGAEAKRLEAIYRQKLTDLAELKQSILQKAFTGELTAKPDRVLAGVGCESHMRA